jgi:hypothetical protein
MSNSETSPENTLNTIPKDRKEQVFFRVVGLSSAKLDGFRQRLDGIPIQAKQRKAADDYVASIELSGPDVCDAISQALDAFPLDAPFGVYVSLLTENESDGVRLAPFIGKFWRSIGGDLDFSFTVIAPDE